ncbi:MAG: menaquinone biosynthesis protein [Archaeoglobaceae archaeon]
MVRLIGKFGFLNNYLPYYHVNGKVVEASPKEMATMLLEGKIVYAPVPSFFYLRNKEILRIYRFCVASDGRVLSVAVFSKSGKLGERIGATTKSVTSVNMLRIILAERGTRAKIFEVDAPDIARFDSVLLIGDEALRALLKYRVAMDVGEAWKDLTGLPAVFGVSASLKNVDASRYDEMILESTRKAYENFEEVVSSAAKAFRYPEELVREYFSLLRFELREKERRGLREFEELARAHKLL